MESGVFSFSRASFVFDFLVIALSLALAAQMITIYLVKVKRRFKAHRTIQLGISTILLIVVVIFEVEVRLNGWTQNALQSPHYDTILFPILWVHIFIAVSSSAIWLATLVGALKHYGKMPAPQSYSKHHKTLGICSTVGLWLTAASGGIFYYLAFVC